MASVALYNMEAQEIGTVELSDDLFNVEIKENSVHQAVVQYLANQRQGTQKAKTRGEVRGGGRKPWRQKGTGHARQGSTRAPQWTHGGVVFAPVPRDYSFKMNRKEKRVALKSALTSRVQENKFIVLDQLKLQEIKTKRMVELLNRFKLKKALIILEYMEREDECYKDDRLVILSSNNIPGVKIAKVNTINVYDILKYDTILTTKAVIPKLEAVYLKSINRRGQTQISEEVEA